ncbi:DUF397 domain-containing protein [Streptomyces luteoverticillatus]|uniref:DUF397 domain-containing protein n=2 Tax=Streptomyces TaxID=1883 RepID=A0A3S9PIU7_STRLT|nr:DUF397 domain-containing protein [Streptomyces luteoverticillatus]
MEDGIRPGAAGLRWMKSSYSGGYGTECVEAAFTVDGSFVRDSLNASGHVIRLTHAAWTHMVTAIRDGKLR